MSEFQPNKDHLRKALFFCFNLKKTAAESHGMLVETYGQFALSERACEIWFQRFKLGDFDTNNKERPAKRKKFEDAKQEVLIEEHPYQTQNKLAETLNVTQGAISRRLKAMRKVYMAGRWVLYEEETLKAEKPSPKCCIKE